MLEYNHEKNEDMIYTELLIKILFEPILERLRDQMKIKKDSKKNTLKTKQEIRKLEKLRAQLNDESKKDLDEEIQKRLEELEQRIIEEQKIYRSLKVEAASEIEDIEAKICKLSKDIEEVDTIKLSSSLRYLSYLCQITMQIDILLCQVFNQLRHYILEVGEKRSWNDLLWRYWRLIYFGIVIFDFFLFLLLEFGAITIISSLGLNLLLAARFCECEKSSNNGKNRLVLSALKMFLNTINLEVM
ncbi:predicted protein [Chaetoceros tenuissimus]|uniref:Uncharacterized protein n=1 Tax=Chaetoceros tenuissimus TaxID=426638 RepID=A0AAD3CE14_9STRA|nr:predicted protein [Chaetoceros tenuissimus]